MKFQIIGCGKMGEVILKGILNFGILSQDIVVEEANEAQREHLQSTYNINFWTNPQADIIILAVKPQQIGEIDFSQFSKSALIFSIMAGITIEKLENLTDNKNIVRSMPNLPLSIGRGVIGYVKYDDNDQEKTQLLVDIFSKIGKVIRLKDEDQIDRISTISWSWPAYFYYLTEILTQQAKELWFSDDDALAIAQETFVWSAILLDQSWLSATQLKTNVASKGGSTQAALDTMKNEGIETAVQKWIKSAYARAKELGK